jgi:hypothetical protein
MFGFNPRREVLATLLETDLEDPIVEKVYEKARLVPTCSTFRNIFCSRFPIRLSGLVFSFLCLIWMPKVFESLLSQRYVEK